LQPRAGGGDAVGGALRDYDFTRSWHRRGATRRRAATLSSSPRIGSRKRPGGVVSTTRQRLSGELLSQVHRIADAHPARRTDRCEYADVRAMMKRGGAQDGVIAREVLL